MARSGDGLGKKNSKLDAFLKKTLEADTYERIRVTDSCIVCSEKENKAFKYVILTDEWIYLTENPPKKIYEEVHLRDIQSIELANDYPDFLSGDERDNCQHVIIKHLAEFDNRGKKPKKSRTVSIFSARSDSSSSSLNSSRSGITSTRSESALMSNRFKTRSKSATSQLLLSPSRAKKVTFDNKSGMASTPEFRNKSSSLDARTLRELGIGSMMDNNNSSKMESKNVEDKKSPKKKKSKKKGQIIDEELQGELKLDLANIDGNNENEENQFEPDEEEEDEDSSGEYIIDPDSNIKTAVLHLYIMSGISPFLTLAKGAWNNYIIKGTLEEDDDYRLRQLIYVPKTGPGLSERLEMQFTQLRTELLDNNNTMEDIFRLILELKNAAERQFFLKKMFWKSSELFHFVIRHLKRYLPTSDSVIDGYNEGNKHCRADELEFVNLIVETLYLMFRETEILATRINTLKMGKGNLVKELISVITAQPEIAGVFHESPSALGTELLRKNCKSSPVTFVLGQGDDRVDLELEKLCEELTDHSTALMFEIFLVAQQGTFQEDAMFFTVEWIVKILEDLDTTPVFVERIIANLLNTVSPLKGKVPLNPQESILLYHQLAVLDYILTSSPELLKYVQQVFYEEFQAISSSDTSCDSMDVQASSLCTHLNYSRYYVQVHIVRRKVPKYYLVRPYIMNLFTEIVTMVLGKEVRF